MQLYISIYNTKNNLKKYTKLPEYSLTKLLITYEFTKKTDNDCILFLSIILSRVMTWVHEEISIN